MIRKRLILVSSLVILGCTPRACKKREIMYEEVNKPDSEKSWKKENNHVVREVKELKQLEINWRQWSCCKDICSRKNNLQSVKQVVGSPYLECTCKDGRIFEIRKKKQKAKYNDPGKIYIPTRKK